MKGVVTIYTSAQEAGGVDTTFVGDFAVDGSTRTVSFGSSSVTLTTAGYNNLLSQLPFIANGHFREIR